MIPRRSLTALLLLLPFVLLVGSSASGAPIRIDFAGTIDTVNDPGGHLQPGFGLGAAFSGTITLDLLFAFEITPGIYTLPVSSANPFGPTTMTGQASLGTANAIGVGTVILVQDAVETFAGMADLWAVTFSGAGAFGVPAQGFSEGCSLALADTTGTANPGGFYAPASLGPFTDAAFGCDRVQTVATSQGTQVTSVALVFGAISQFTVTTVPEPGVAALLALLLLATSERRWRVR